MNDHNITRGDGRSPPILYWLRGEETQNFGDFLAELFVQRAFVKPRVSASAFRLIGSAIDDGIIRKDLEDLGEPDAGKIAFWCCGARDDTGLSKPSMESSVFFGVRGPLTRDVLGLPKDTPFGDPGLLLPLLYRPGTSEKTAGKTICVPHFNDLKPDENLLAASGADVVVRPQIKSTMEDLFRILDDLASARFVLTGSLHAAIVACAYDVPFCYWDNGHVDIPFKWRDFSASIHVSACFVNSIQDGIHVYDTLFRKRIRKPPLFPILAVAPFYVQIPLLLAAAVAEASLSNSAQRLDLTLLSDLIERSYSYAEIGDLSVALRQEKEKIRGLEETIAAKDAQITEYLYHLNRINASPWSRFGMWVTKGSGRTVAALPSLAQRIYSPVARRITARARARQRLARRREGRFNILYFSPVKSHPANHGNRTTVNQFARHFQSKGHRVHFVLLQTEECTARDIQDMRAAWDTFNRLPCRNPMTPSGPSVPFDGWYEEGLGERIRHLCARYDIDIVFCTYVFQSKLLEFVPAHILKVIDTHDKMGDRYEMLRANGQPLEFFSCTPEEEGRYLRRADVVSARREQEARYFDEVTGRRSAIVIPHIEPPQFLERSAARVANVGIVASENLINLTIVRQCLRAIEQEVNGAACPFVVNVAGEVKKMIERLPAEQSAIFRRPWVRLLGYVPDIREFYESVDLILSPVTMGTGINVKTVQAMAYGMPLLSTRHGSKGIETGDPAHEHENLASLAKALFAMVDRPGELQRLAALSRERYVRFYADGVSALDTLFAHPKLNAEVNRKVPATVA